MREKHGVREPEEKSDKEGRSKGRGEETASEGTRSKKIMMET